MPRRSDTYRGLADPLFATIPWRSKWPLFRRRVWERDAGVCLLCGQAVPLEHMDLDHIVQRAEGGNDLYPNLRAAHVRCNRARRRVPRGRRIVSSNVLFFRPSAAFRVKLKGWAKRNRRSLNEQVLMALEAAIEQDEAARGPIAPIYDKDDED